MPDGYFTAATTVGTISYPSGELGWVTEDSKFFLDCFHPERDHYFRGVIGPNGDTISGKVGLYVLWPPEEEGSYEGTFQATRSTTANAVTVSIAAASVSEGNAGQSTLSFPVQATNNGNTASPAVTVRFSTQDGTAQAGTDYTTVSNLQVNIPAIQPGASTTVHVPVMVTGDTAAEQDETFTATLSNPSSGVSLSAPSATGTIVNDDGAEARITRVDVRSRLEGGTIVPELVVHTWRRFGSATLPIGLDTVLNGKTVTYSEQRSSNDAGGEAGPEFEDPAPLVVSLSKAGVPRFLDDVKFTVNLSVQNGGSVTVADTRQSIIRLPTILIPGIFNGEAGDDTFPEFVAALIEKSGLDYEGSGAYTNAPLPAYRTLYTLTYPTTYASFAEGASELAALMREVRLNSYADAVNLIAHSKGGLVARQYLTIAKNNPGVARLITCLTPHLGSVFAGPGIIPVGPLANLAPTYPWTRSKPRGRFKSTPNRELDALNKSKLPKTYKGGLISYILIYSSSVATPTTRTVGVWDLGAGDGLVPYFSQAALDHDPYRPERPGGELRAFAGLRPFRKEISGFHGGYLAESAVQDFVYAQLTSPVR